MTKNVQDNMLVINIVDTITIQYTRIYQDFASMFQQRFLPINYTVSIYSSYLTLWTYHLIGHSFMPRD